MNDLDSIIADISKTVNAPRSAGMEQSYRQESANPLSLHGGKPPTVEIQNEKPEHRVIMLLLAQGCSPAEVAEATGYTVVHIRNLRRQPWFREKFTALMTELGKDAVQAWLKSEIPASLETLASIRDDDNQRGATRVAAANSILDRGLGKATVRIETKTLTPTDEAVQEVEALRKEAADLSKKLAANGVSQFTHSSS